ncbi:DNA-binding transcriptional MocR family regulator [Paeniglutamicibacter cryotolerans]|uniref:DNA-binding transcriptional MocR family regulator n=2 Tax=Paeniglutamicibacter cryotolerans TaxID=670079 RepID=A0A839QHC1_9MICC|nr:DNA-binding transcriptional MocR family regulator [Paeniglutamicibacter cryotolerans]
MGPPLAQLTAPGLRTMLGENTGARPAYAWLSESIRTLVSNGRVLHGTRLPSERELVHALGLSRTTVSRAYAELRERGFAEARRGSGTQIRIPGGSVGGGAEPLVPGGTDAVAGVLDLTCAAPLAPVGLAGYFERALDELPGYINGMGYYPNGLPVLREAIAEDYRRRGLPTVPEQVIVTAGALAGIAITSRALLGPGARVAVETPTYPNSVASLRQHGSRIIPVSQVTEGSDLPGIEKVLGSRQVAAMLALPDFHNPTGTLLDAPGRERWAAALRRNSVQGIVDETNAELWLDADPELAPMAAWNRDIVTVSSASKTYWGGLRLGWIRAPHRVATALARAKSTLDLGAPVLEQLVLAAMLRARPGLDQSTRTGMREGRDLLLAGLAARLPDWEVRRPAGGLSLWANLPLPASTALSREAEARGLRLAPGSAFAVESHGLEHWVRIPYALQGPDLERALPLLESAWAAAAAGEPARGRPRA